MPLNLSGYSTPVNQFGGLYKTADDLERNNRYDKQEKDKNDAQKASMSKFLEDYTDPHEYLSGSPMDANVVQGLGDALQTGVSMINENPGMSTNMLMMALAPKVNRIHQYATTAQQVQKNIKERAATIDPNSGYDKFNLVNEAKKQAFYTPDGQLKDFSTIDPNTDWVTEAVKNNPENVTTNKGLDEWLKGEQKVVNTRTVKRINSRGGSEYSKVKTTAYPWAVADEDQRGVTNGSFVPKYQTAIDGGEPIVHEFTDNKGGTVKAPIRLLSDDVFRNIMQNSRGTADWLRGQVKQHLKDYKTPDGKPIDINSPQATNVGKAILYDELKSRGIGGMEDVEINKANPVNLHFENRLFDVKHPMPVRVLAGGDAVLRDVYTDIKNKVEKDLGNGNNYTQINQLDPKAQSIILKFVNDATKSSLTQADIYLKKDKEGNITVYGVDGKTPSQTDKPIMSLPYEDVNIEANQQLGANSKKEVLQRAHSAGTNGGKQKSTKRDWSEFKVKSNK